MIKASKLVPGGFHAAHISPKLNAYDALNSLNIPFTHLFAKKLLQNKMKGSTGAEVIIPQVNLDTNLEMYSENNSVHKCNILFFQVVRCIMWWPYAMQYFFL